MVWAVIAAGVAIVAAALLVRHYYGGTAKRVADALRALLGERGVRIALFGLYGGTLVLWIGLYLWARNEGVGGDNPFDRALGDLIKR